MEVKIYAITTPEEQLVAVKLTRSAALSLAKLVAPAKVTLLYADKIEGMTSINPSIKPLANQQTQVKVINRITT